MESVSIGLDVGASAVRAVEIEIGAGRPVLRRYGQVGLAPGAVVDGEIINPGVVSAALRRLWEEAGFTSTKVVLGVSGPRVIVRQADVPALSTEEMRSSLKFDAQELIPIPMDDASFDFTVLDGLAEPNGPGGKETKRILIVAAHRDLLRGYLGVLKSAGLSAIAIDATPLALLRAVPGAGPDGAQTGIDVIVSIGAELTTVAVREDGVPRFIRSLTVGGSKLTETIAGTLHLELAVAERLKRGSVPAGTTQLAQARKASSVEMRDLADDVRATIDFFIAQSTGATIDRLLVTGGASQTEGLAAAIAGTSVADLWRIDPFSGLKLGDTGFTARELEKASATVAAAVGLALWPVESPLIRISVLPEEVAAARRARRIVSMAGVGVAGLAALLAVASAGQIVAVHSAQHQAHTAQAQVATLTGQVTELQAQTAVHSRVEAQAALLVGDLSGDVDWVRVLGQLAAVMPSDLEMTTFTGSRTLTGSTPAGSVGIGAVTFSVQGTGGLDAVAAWMTGLQRDPDFKGTWVSGITVSAQGKVTFSSTSNLTSVADSNRAQAVQP